MLNEMAKAELDQIAAGGTLRAEAVVESARKENSPLHGYFTWNDDEAAEKFRVQQARQLIRVYIKYEPRVQRETRAYVSVPSDRVNGDGYRSTSDVLDNPNYRIQVLEDALKRIGKLRTNFSYLPELENLFNRLDAVIAEYRQELLTKRVGA